MPSTAGAKKFKVQQDYTTLLIPHWYRTAGPTVGTTKIISHLQLLPTVLCSDSWNLDLEEQDIHFARKPTSNVDYILERFFDGELEL